VTDAPFLALPGSLADASLLGRILDGIPLRDSLSKRFDSFTAFDSWFTRGDTSGIPALNWELINSGQPPSGGNGPGSNSGGPYINLDTTGSPGPPSQQHLRSGSACILDMSLFGGEAARTITLRICLGGLASQSGVTRSLGVWLQEPGGTWEAYTRIRFWESRDDYEVGDTATQFGTGAVLEVVLPGGWVDFLVAIPDGYTGFRMASAGGAGANPWNAFDLNFWSARLEWNK